MGAYVTSTSHWVFALIGVAQRSNVKSFESLASVQNLAHLESRSRQRPGASQAWLLRPCLFSWAWHQGPARSFNLEDLGLPAACPSGMPSDCGHTVRPTSRRGEAESLMRNARRRKVSGTRRANT